MTDVTTTPIPRVRTYARDLEDERRKRGLSAPANDRANTQTPTTPTTQKTPLLPVQEEAKPTTSLTHAPAPTPTPHIVAVPERPTNVSAAVQRTREDEMKNAAAALPISIPSLHDLKMGADMPEKKTFPARPVAKEAAITITDDESGATIITDTKADRFKVAPSIFSSLKKWWSNRQSERKARRAPKYVVPQTERRKGIIQQATSHSGKAITDDRAQLRDQVMRRGNVPTPREPDTTWTPNTETIFPLLEAPEIELPARVTNVTVTPKQRGEVHAPVVPLPAAPAPVMTPPPTPTTSLVLPVAAPVIVPPPTPVTSPTTPIVTEVVKTPEPAAIPAREPEPVTVREDEVVDEDEPHADISKSVTREELRARLAAQQTTTTKRWSNTNLLSAAIVCAVVVITAAVFGVRSYLTAPEPIPPPTYTGVLLSAPTINLPLTTLDRTVLMQTLDIANDTRSVPAVELFFINESTVVPPATLLSLFNPSIDQNLAQNVRSVVFGWYNQDIPFIVLNIADRVGVWGGLLKEESVLTTTLKPFFTFPTTLEGGFIDRKITNYDMRLLVDKTGSEYLAYSFISDNTVIITKNHETLLLLAALASEQK